jgi:hypothetical protein
VPHRPARPAHAARPARAAAALTLVVGALLATGCAGPSGPPGAVPFDLYTHCGIHELVHDGQWYERVGGALDDGSGNPPDGWDNPEQAGWLLVEGDRATFTDDHGHEEEFERRDGATEPIQVCA